MTVDADTLLEKNALATILARRESSGAACVAGNLLVADTNRWVQRMQIYDYLISIAAVKRYQGSYGATLVAQGAFSAYETCAVKQIGGWTQGAGEDIVLTYRLLALAESLSMSRARWDLPLCPAPCGASGVSEHAGPGGCSKGCMR